jgi:hypothetical protein
MIYSVEEIEDAAYSALTTLLPDALAAITARRAAADQAAGRTVELVVPRPGESPAGDYYLGAAGEILRWPAIEIGVPSIDLSSFDIADRDADGTGPLIVATHVSNARKDLLRRSLQRTTAAVTECLLSPIARAGASVESVRVAFAWNPETGENDEIQSVSLVVVTLGTTNLAP